MFTANLPPPLFGQCPFPPHPPLLHRYISILFA